MRSHFCDWVPRDSNLCGASGIHLLPLKAAGCDGAHDHVTGPAKSAGACRERDSASGHGSWEVAALPRGPG